jgi:hypothetical protein
MNEQTFDQSSNRLKTFIKNIQLLPGDKCLYNVYGSTVMLTNDDLRRSITIMSAGRFFERPDFDRDAACIVLHEDGDVDRMVTSHGKTTVSDQAGGSFALINADKVRINARKGSIGITGHTDIVVSPNEKLIVVTGDDLLITVYGNASIVSKGSMSIEASQDMTLKAKSITLDASAINLGKNAMEPAVLGTTMQTWDNTHVHPSAIGPTLVPTAQLPPNALSKVVKIK